MLYGYVIIAEDHLRRRDAQFVRHLFNRTSFEDWQLLGRNFESFDSANGRGRVSLVRERLVDDAAVDGHRN